MFETKSVRNCLVDDHPSLKGLKLGEAFMSGIVCFRHQTSVRTKAKYPKAVNISLCQTPLQGQSHHAKDRSAGWVQV